MSESLIAELARLQARFDVSEWPDTSRVPAQLWGKPISPEARQLQEKISSATQIMNTLNNTAGRLLLQNKDLVRRAGVSEKALESTNPAPCWYVAVNDLVGSKSQLPTGKESET
jgi:hypothetical protein